MVFRTIGDKNQKLSCRLHMWGEPVIILFSLLYLLQDNNILVNLKIKKYNWKLFVKAKKLDFLKIDQSSNPFTYFSSFRFEEIITNKRQVTCGGQRKRRQKWGAGGGQRLWMNPHDLVWGLGSCPPQEAKPAMDIPFMGANSLLALSWFQFGFWHLQHKIKCYIFQREQGRVV